MEPAPGVLNPILNIAHRGASAYAPENTFEAYDLALAMGADALELDIRQTRDGQLIVFHDETVTRTTRGAALPHEYVRDLGWTDISCRDSGAWFNDRHPVHARPEYSRARVPRLHDVLARYGTRVTYFIELKHQPCRTGMEIEVAELLRHHGLDHEIDGRPRAYVAAFSQPSLQALRKLAPNLALVQLFHPYATPAAIRSYLGALPDYCNAAGPFMHSIDEQLVTAAQLHGLEIFSWTANDITDMRRLIDLRVDGVVTDLPERFEQARRNRARTSRKPDSAKPIFAAEEHSGTIG